MTTLKVYFGMYFAVDYHWKDAEGKVYEQRHTEDVYDIPLDYLVNVSANKVPTAASEPNQDAWNLFDGQWYAVTTGSAFDFETVQNLQEAEGTYAWQLNRDRMNQANIEKYVQDNVLHLYAMWNAKPIVSNGMINLFKQVEGDIAKATTTTFEFKLTMTIDNEEAKSTGTRAK